MSIFLIRHGKTPANEQHLYCGSTDIELSEKGREELAHRSYKVEKPVLFVTSGMKRCNDTLNLLFGNVPYTVMADFREIDFGIFEMKSYEQLKEDAEYQKWISGDNHVNVPPEGESGAQMTKRVLHAFAEVQKMECNVVVITHGGVIAAIMASLFPEEGKNLYQWQPRPGCGYRLEGDRYETTC